MNTDLKAAGASYIATFYQEINLLNHNYAIYLNSNLELANKCGNDPAKIRSMPSSELQTINQVIQLIRISIIKTYLGYKTISKNIKVEENKKLEELYTKLIGQYNFVSNDLESYIMEINNVLVSDIIQELVENSHALLQQIYSNERRT